MVFDSLLYIWLGCYLAFVIDCIKSSSEEIGIIPIMLFYSIYLRNLLRNLDEHARY